MATIKGGEIVGQLDALIADLRKAYGWTIDNTLLPEAVSDTLKRAGGCSDGVAGSYRDSISSRLNRAADLVNDAVAVFHSVSADVQQANRRLRHAGAPAEYETD